MFIGGILMEEVDLKKNVAGIKEIDEEYRQNLNIPKYILMIVAKITELSKEEQNQIGLCVFNSI